MVCILERAAPSNSRGAPPGSDFILVLVSGLGVCGGHSSVGRAGGVAILVLFAAYPHIGIARAACGPQPHLVVGPVTRGHREETLRRSGARTKAAKIGCRPCGAFWLKNMQGASSG